MRPAICTPATHQLVRDMTIRFGDKWSLDVILGLLDGPRRFTQLQDVTGAISHRVLTATLRGLQRDGLVRREEFDEVPRRVVYELTALGQSLSAPVAAIVHWASQHEDDVAQNRETYDRQGSAPETGATAVGVLAGLPLHAG